MTKAFMSICVHSQPTFTSKMQNTTSWIKVAPDVQRTEQWEPQPTCLMDDGTKLEQQQLQQNLNVTVDIWVKIDFFFQWKRDFLQQVITTDFYFKDAKCNYLDECSPWCAEEAIQLILLNHKGYSVSVLLYKRFFNLLTWKPSVARTLNGSFYFFWHGITGEKY